MAEFPDIFACVSCEKALFVDEEDRASEQFACPFCHHEHTPEDALGLDEPEEPATEDVAIEDTAVEESPEAKPAAEEPADEALFADESTETSDAEPAETSKEEDIELLVEEPTEPKPEPETETESDSDTEEAKLEGDHTELFIDEPIESESMAEEDPEKDPVIEEPKADIEVPVDLELPDVFACLSCDNALFLDETERKTGDFSCTHCGQKNSAAKTRAVAAEQLATVEEVAAAPAAEHKFDELIECPGCEKAIKLIPEERDEASVNCPYCKRAIAAPELPVEEEPSEEVISEEVEPVESPEEETPQEEGVQEAEIETPKPEAEEETGQPESGANPDPEEAPLSVDEQEETLSAEPAEKAEGEETGEEETGEEEPEEAAQEVDRGLLESLIESSRNQSLMPERFACPKCEKEIQLPEAERQMGVCFCPECEELVDSKTAYENTSDEPEPVDSDQVEEGEGATPEETEPVEAEGEGAADEDNAEQDSVTSQEETAAEMEFWLGDLLAATIDCSKCDNSLKLEDEEKIFGIYRCPYCKADINHAKGAVIESLIPKLGDEEEEEEPAAKRKPINLKALLPYAAVLVFGVALNYGVITVTGYIQEKKALKAQWELQLKSDWVELEQPPKVFDRALTNATNKASFARLEEMSVDELKAFHEHLVIERREAYADWFEHTGDEIKVDSEFGPVVERFRRKLDRFMRRVQLAKIDADNLETATGISSFERQRAYELLDKHMTDIRNQMHGLSAEDAIDMALVRPELLADLMKFNLMVDQFEMQSIRQAVVHLSSMTQLANLIEKQYDLNPSPGDDAVAKDQDDRHSASSGHEEELSAHASHGDGHSEPSGHKEEPSAHASHGDEHSVPSGHEEEPSAHASHGDDHADHSGHGHSSHASVKPGTSVGAQTEQEKAEIERAKAFVKTKGLTWGGQGTHRTKGLFTYERSSRRYYGKAYFGTGGTKADQFAQVTKPKLRIEGWEPLKALWNAEVFHWQDHQAKRAQEHQPQWEEVVAEYGHLLDSLSDFQQQLKTLRDGSVLSRLDHPFLDGAVLRLKVDEFRALEGVGTLVSHNVEARLERLAKLLDPYAPGSLAYDLNDHKSRGVKLTHEQAGEFYERFWEQWKQFHLEQHWFELEGVSAYYHLARYDSTSSANAHH